MLAELLEGIGYLLTGTNEAIAPSSRLAKLLIVIAAVVVVLAIAWAISLLL